MRLEIRAIGKLKRSDEKALRDEYLGRCRAIGRRMHITPIEEVELRESAAATRQKRIEEESASLLGVPKTDGALLVLDERGTSLKSSQMASWLDEQRSGAKDVTVLIGGADGLSADVREHASALWSFGAQTWPHRLVRIMVLEQLYRMMTIIDGHPYHRED